MGRGHGYWPLPVRTSAKVKRPVETFPAGLARPAVGVAVGRDARGPTPAPLPVSRGR